MVGVQVEALVVVVVLVEVLWKHLLIETMTTVMRFSFFSSTIDKITASLFLLNQLVACCFFSFFSCDSPIFKIKFLKNEQL